MEAVGQKLQGRFISVLNNFYFDIFCVLCSATCIVIPIFSTTTKFPGIVHAVSVYNFLSLSFSQDCVWLTGGQYKVEQIFLLLARNACVVVNENIGSKIAFLWVYYRQVRAGK